MRRPSGMRYAPSTRSTVTPAKLPTRCRRPVSALKRVVFPVFGLPMMATRSGSVAESRSGPAVAVTSARGASLRHHGDAFREIVPEREAGAAHVDEQAVALADHGDLRAF